MNFLYCFRGADLLTCKTNAASSKLGAISVQLLRLCPLLWIWPCISEGIKMLCSELLPTHILCGCSPKTVLRAAFLSLFSP